MQEQQGPHTIVDDDKYGASVRYIHKYNARSSPGYTFSVAVIQHQNLTEKVMEGQQYMSHVLHPEIGGLYAYKKVIIWGGTRA